MKFALFVVLACVLAFAAAAPQYLTYPGTISTINGFGYGPLSRTVVAGPTVLNGLTDPRLLAPGYICGPGILC